MNLTDAAITAISYVRQPQKRKLIRKALTLMGKSGLEIGGPSAFFGKQGGFPIYLSAKSVDNINYESDTVFGLYKPGKTFHYYPEKTGWQYISEGFDLSEIGNEAYDFVLSCHSLEHIANPIKALKEWFRVLKPGGTMILILPDKRSTFDKHRNYTSLEHLQDDYKLDTSEDDRFHIEEILATYNEELGKVSFEKYNELLDNNFVTRCAHHHVYNHKLLDDLLTIAGFKTTYLHEMPPFHLIAVGQKIV